jgi:hypothetical protein
MVNREKEYAAVKKSLWLLFPTEEQAVAANMDYFRSTYECMMESGFVHNVVMIKGRAIGSEEGLG